MEPEETAPPKSKKFFKIAIGTVTVIAVLLAIAFFLTALKNAKQAELQALNNATEAIREPTEAEKLAKAQIEEVDILRAQYQALMSSSTATTIKNQTKTLDELRSQALKQKTTQATSVIIKKTHEQEIQEMDALRAAFK